MFSLESDVFKNKKTVRLMARLSSMSVTKYFAEHIWSLKMHFLSLELLSVGKNC